MPAEHHVPGRAEEIFQRAFRHHGEFDIAEMSLSTHLVTHDGAR